jgi:hypothetical protein
MATDLEQLQVTLSAKADQFKQEMQSAVREFDRDANQIEQRNQQLSQSMNTSMQSASASAKFLAGALKSLLSVYAIQQFINAIKQANQELSDLGKKADDTRISAQNIAGLRLAGVGQGASTKEIDAALDHFTAQSKKTEEDAKGLYRALSQIDPAFATAFKSAPTQTERLNILSRAFGATNNETKKAQLAVNAFGTDNERVIRTVESAGGSLTTLADKARAAGIEIDDGLAKKAQEAQKQFDVLAEITAAKLTVAFGSLVPFLQSTVAEIGRIVDLINQAEKSTAGFFATAQKLLLLDKGGDKVGRNLNAPRGTPANPDYALPGEEANVPLPFRRPVGTGGSGGEPAFAGRENLGKSGAAKDDELDREEKRIQKQINALKGKAAAETEVGEAIGYAEAKTRLLEAAEASGRGKTAADKLEIERLAEAYGKYTNALKVANLEKDIFFEREQIGRTPEEQAIASRTRGMGAEDAKRLGDEMRRNQNLLEGKEMAGSFVKGLISDLENGVKAGQALENQLKRIADKLADKAIDSLISGLFGGLTGKGGLLGGVFGVPSQAGGGWAGHGPLVNVPASAFIGAKHFAAGGGIPAILHAGEIVLNQAQQKNVAQGLGPSKPISITHAPTISGLGMTQEQAFAFVTRSQKEFARNILPILNNAQRRYG